MWEMVKKVTFVWFADYKIKKNESEYKKMIKMSKITIK